MFNDTVHMKFKILFSIQKYENASVSLCEIFNVYSCLLFFKSPFLAVRTVKPEDQ